MTYDQLDHAPWISTDPNICDDIEVDDMPAMSSLDAELPKGERRTSLGNDDAAAAVVIRFLSRVRFAGTVEESKQYLHTCTDSIRTESGFRLDLASWVTL